MAAVKIAAHHLNKRGGILIGDAGYGLVYILLSFFSSSGYKEREI
jgi:hypothetical protein